MGASAEIKFVRTFVLQASEPSRRAFLRARWPTNCSFEDWTGCLLCKARQGKILKPFEPILSRIDVDGSSWCDLVKKSGRMFKRAVPTQEHLSAEAHRSGQGWMQESGRNHLRRPPQTFHFERHFLGCNSHLKYVGGPIGNARSRGTAP